jgi:hypothetical protein
MLADLCQRKLELKAGQPVAMERMLPAFTRASQNVATAAALLDALPTPSTGGVGKMYQLLKNILGTTVAQQAESSLQHRVEASALPLARP